MASNARTNQENQPPACVQPGKIAPATRIQTTASRRQALGEIKNQISSRDAGFKKPAEPVKPKSKLVRTQSGAVTKKEIKTATSAATSNTTTTTRTGINSRTVVKGTAGSSRLDLKLKTSKVEAPKNSKNKQEASRICKKENLTVNKHKDEVVSREKKQTSSVSADKEETVKKNKEDVVRINGDKEENQRTDKNDLEQMEMLRRAVPKKKPSKFHVDVDCNEEQKDVIMGLSYSAHRFVEEDNLSLVSGYEPAIFNYLLSLEKKYELRDKFLVSHKTSPRMRCIVVDWLVEVHMNFHMLSETLHLCVAIIDCYLSRHRNIGKQHLQLLGITSLWVASKYEEIYIPVRSDFLYVCDNACSVNDINRMELSILRTLDFQLGFPLPIHFLRRFSKLAQITAEHHSLGKYMLELALLEPELRSFRPSLQAAAATFLSIAILADEAQESRIWTQKMVCVCQYIFKDLKELITLMAKALLNVETSRYQAVKDKYATSDNYNISLSYELKGPVVKKFAQIRS